MDKITIIKFNKSVHTKQFLELVKKAETGGKRIIIESQGQGKVAIINYADFEHLEALEDAIDSGLLCQVIA